MKIFATVFNIFALAALITPPTDGDVTMLSRTAAIAATIHSYQPGVKDLAYRCACSANLLYRASLLGDSGCDLSFGKVERLIDVTHNFTVLDWLNNRFGFFKVRPPRVPINKMSEGDTLNHLQTVALGALQSLKEFFMQPTSKTRNAADRKLTDCLAAVESIRKRVRGKDFNQLEMEF